MRNSILITILSILLFGCKTNSDKKSSIIDTNQNTKDSLIDKKSERFFPLSKTTAIFDTLISDNQIQIRIIKSDLDTYVTKEYDNNGVKQIDKYRDAEVKLTIKRNTQILLDTIFRKKQFSKYAENGFMDIAIFHNYWFKRIDKNRIELFGVINEPETDWAIAFNHYFDLNSRKLTFKEELSDEE